jgi:hypothetical protein
MGGRPLSASVWITAAVTLLAVNVYLQGSVPFSQLLYNIIILIYKNIIVDL